MAKDGRRLDISLTVSPVRDADGPRHRRVEGRPRHHRRRSGRSRSGEAAAGGGRGRAARLAEVFRRAPSFLAILRGPEHVFELANDRYYQLVGDRDILGKPVREALPEVEGQGFFELLDGVYRTGEAFVGADMRVLVRAAPRPAARGAVPGVRLPAPPGRGRLRARASSSRGST